MNKLIDAEKYRKEFLDSRDFEPMKILDLQPPVQAIPLDEVKQAKEEIEKLDLNDFADNLYKFQTKCTGILDKLIKKRGKNTTDVELAIKVPEEVYDAIMHKNSKHLELDAFYVIDEMGKAIANGTQLPKGHGRLFDEKDIVNGNYEIIANKIYELEPIIEADKAESEV